MTNENRFAYGFNTSTINKCGLGLPEEFELVAKVGYDAIEPWVSEIETFLEQGGDLDELRSLAERLELRIVNLIAFFPWAHPDPAKREDGLDDAGRVFGMARELDCAYVAAPPSGISDRTDIALSHIAECYVELLDLGREHGTKPLLEFWGHASLLGTLDEAVEIVAMVDDPDAAILVDVFHMMKGGSDLGLLTDLEANEVGLIHMNDYPRSPHVSELSDSERIYPGDGAAPIAQILGSLAEIGYGGVLSLELFNKSYQESGAARVAEEGLEKMKRAVER